METGPPLEESEIIKAVGDGYVPLGRASQDFGFKEALVEFRLSIGILRNKRDITNSSQR